jgi:hypothetical protein
VIPGIFIGVGALIALYLRSGRKQRPLGRNEIVRLSLYSERKRREELHPFE